jgi:sec-independent protein translocase protein TatB
MEILGIGPSELVFIVIIALIVLGPKDMQKAGKSIGRWLNQLVRSDGWKAFQRTTTEIRNLPTNLMREANMELNEAEKDIRKNIGPSPFAYQTRKQPASSSTSGLTPPQEAENSIQPPPAIPQPDTNIPESQTPNQDA